MGTRGRKSAAELATIRPVRRPSAYDRPTSSHEPSPPPDHLTPATKAWWTSIVTDYELEPYQLHVLQAAGEAWDLYQFARAELAKHGLTFSDAKGMVRARPEAAIARDARTSFLRAVRELKLDVPEPKPPRYGGVGVSWEDLQR
jgi:phage terminase small subunit